VVRVGVVADTHIPHRARVVPGVIFHALRDVELILHAGDILVPEVLDELSSLAPVRAVYGNADPPELQAQLTSSLLLELGGFTIGLTHGDRGEGDRTSERALAVFEAEDCDCIVFGHSHQPCCGYREEKLLFNPGSPTDPRQELYPTFGVLNLGSRLTGRIFRFEPESNMVLGEYSHSC